MRSVRFNDGTEFPVKSCGIFGANLWLNIITDITFVDAVLFLEKPENTSSILYFVSGKENDGQTFSGFTQLICVQKSEDGYLIGFEKKEDEK